MPSQVENIPRSRFRDVLPYEENRVRLTNPDKENKTGFINASHLSATIGPDAQRFYIAAQGRYSIENIYYSSTCHVIGLNFCLRISLRFNGIYKLPICQILALKRASN